MTFKPSSASRIRTPHFMTGSSWSFIGALTLLGHGTDVILEDGLWRLFADECGVTGVARRR